MEKIKYCVIVCTCPSKEIAELISKTLLEEKLIACANMIPSVFSIFWWKEKIENEMEVLLILKTKSVLFETIKNRIKFLHPYEIPEILGLPVENGNPDYLNWIDQSVLGPS